MEGILTAISSSNILTIILTCALTYFITFWQFKKQHVFLNKEERYKELILKLSAFYGQTATTENKKIFFIEYYKSWLYASSPVLRALKDIIESVKLGNINSIPIGSKKRLLSNVIVAIRKDIGISSENLSNDFFEYIEVIPSPSKINR